MNRLLKQLFYGLFYLVLLFAIGLGVYFLALKPAPTCFDNKLNQGEEEVDCGGPCPSCELKRLEPLKISPVIILESGEDLITAIFEIRNPNRNYGSDKFTYVLNIYDSAGNNLASFSEESFIYASQIKTVVEPGLKIKFAKIARSEVLVADLSWRPRTEFSLPKIQTREIKVNREKTGVTVMGVLVNENAFRLPQVGISAVVYDGIGLENGGSKTFARDVEAFEERFFKIFIPISIGAIDSKLTRVFMEARQ
ncbi:MAG TPA: hypothetical protein VJK04_01990 [Candidatus Paceibacterota bacterium]|uniref:Uncharacterized protein n=1 Tax=Candidatus Harrisonbacteria bacterium RIFCSPLOWO2_01_FULL_44_18 TaxID=1798407 RepID=A0A1G1ZND7_9BACT|nr:MAG: hypothetical protein A3A16_02585 [Candidatus Harrisonbacteria bacterium RIFCSPLOWO2_01_FULL_44_18]